jgi:hypothetical protein
MGDLIVEPAAAAVDLDDQPMTQVIMNDIVLEEVVLAS